MIRVRELAIVISALVIDPLVSGPASPAVGMDSCGCVIVKASFCVDSDTGIHCLPWVQAPLQIRGVVAHRGSALDSGEWHQVKFSDSTGVTTFTCVPVGRYVVRGLLMGYTSVGRLQGREVRRASGDVSNATIRVRC